jgi:hypothetical protein
VEGWFAEKTASEERVSDRRKQSKPKDEVTLPESFVWDAPQWIRTDRFRASPLKFLSRVVIGGFIGLLLGRVVGSLEGIFLQWVYGGLETMAGPMLNETLGRGLYWLTLIVAKVLSPFFFASPLQDTLHALESQKTAAVALLLLAQLHGALNGLHQGLRPALGDRLLAIIEKIILPWGLLWRGLTFPFMRIFFRPPPEAELKALLADPTDSAAKKRLTSLARQGRLPGIESTSELWPERETIARYSGKHPAGDREELWWRNAGFRRDVYQWIEQERAEKAIPLVIKGLSDPDQSARESAVKALASIKRIETIRYLALALDDDDPVSGVAAGALRSIGASM